MASVHGTGGFSPGQTYSISELQTLQQQHPLKETASTAETATAEPSFKDQTSKESGGFVSKLYNRLFNKQEFVSSTKELGKTLAATTDQVKGAVSKPFQKACNRILVKMGSPTSQEALKHLDAFRETGELPEGLSPGVGREILKQATRTKMKSRNLEPLKRQLETKIPFDPAASVENLVDSYGLAKELGNRPEELEMTRQQIEELLISKKDDEAGRKELGKNILTPTTLEILLTDNPKPEKALDLIASFSPSSSLVTEDIFPALIASPHPYSTRYMDMLVDGSKDPKKTGMDLMKKFGGQIKAKLSDNIKKAVAEYYTDTFEEAKHQYNKDLPRVNAQIFEGKTAVGQTADMHEIAEKEEKWGPMLLHLAAQTPMNAVTGQVKGAVMSFVNIQLDLKVIEGQGQSKVVINRNDAGKITSVDFAMTHPGELKDDEENSIGTYEISGGFRLALNSEGEFVIEKFHMEETLFDLLEQQVK